MEPPSFVQTHCHDVLQHFVCEMCGRQSWIKTKLPTNAAPPPVLTFLINTLSRTSSFFTRSCAANAKQSPPRRIPFGRKVATKFYLPPQVTIQETRNEYGWEMYEEHNGFWNKILMRSFPMRRSHLYKMGGISFIGAGERQEADRRGEETVCNVDSCINATHPYYFAPSSQTCHT